MISFFISFFFLLQNIFTFVQIFDPPNTKKKSTNDKNIRCDNSGENRKTVSRLASVRCPSGLAFDIERQTCDWKTNVKNCNEVESKLGAV